MAENIIRIYRPELTEAERARRMEQIRQAAARLIEAAERHHHEKEKRNGI